MVSVLCFNLKDRNPPILLLQEISVFFIAVGLCRIKMNGRKERVASSFEIIVFSYSFSEVYLKNIETLNILTTSSVRDCPLMTSSFRLVGWLLSLLMQLGGDKALEHQVQLDGLLSSRYLILSIYCVNIFAHFFTIIRTLFPYHYYIGC